MITDLDAGVPKISKFQISIVLCILANFLYLKTCVNVPTVIYKQKQLRDKNSFLVAS
jgi:hypothetical protein